MHRRKASAFKTGHALNSNKTVQTDSGKEPCHGAPAALPSVKYERLTQGEYRRVVNSPVKSGPVFSPTGGNTMLLRPLTEDRGLLYNQVPRLSPSERRKISEVEGYRLLHMPTTARVFHALYRDHHVFKPKCAGLLVPLSDYEAKWGAGVREVFGCATCGFKSNMFAMFNSVNSSLRGRKSSEINVGLQLACHNTTLSSTGVRKFLSCLSVPSPASSALQKSANSFGPKMEYENERDMALKRKQLQRVLKLRGMAEDSPICAEFDRQYNNPLRTARKQTPFAPASQSRDIIVENVTADKFIIGYHHTNKLCSTGQLRRGKGESVKCPGHMGCTANVGKEFDIGNEKVGGMICANKLLKGDNPIKVNFLTTDADGKACKGFNSIMASAANTETHNLLDEAHLNRSMCRSITNATLTGNMFPSKTAAQKKSLQKRFAEDLSYRVQAEIRACRKFFHHDSQKVAAAMKECTTCILKCYSGNHQECEKLSFVCKKRKPYHFPFMPFHAKGLLEVKGTNENTLSKIISARISQKRLWETRFSTSTQKAEAMNHAFSTTNPKHSRTFSRNGAFRDHSAIHSTNNGPGESIAMKMKAVGIGIHPKSPCMKTLRSMQHIWNKDRLRKRSSSYKTRRATLREDRYKLHSRSRSTNNSSSYRKDQLISDADPSHDHNYCTRGSLKQLKATDKGDTSTAAFRAK